MSAFITVWMDSGCGCRVGKITRRLWPHGTKFVINYPQSTRTSLDNSPFPSLSCLLMVRFHRSISELLQPKVPGWTRLLVNILPLRLRRVAPTHPTITTVELGCTQTLRLHTRAHGLRKQSILSIPTLLVHSRHLTIIHRCTLHPWTTLSGLVMALPAAALTAWSIMNITLAVTLLVLSNLWLLDDLHNQASLTFKISPEHFFLRYWLDGFICHFDWCPNCWWRISVTSGAFLFFFEPYFKKVLEVYLLRPFISIHSLPPTRCIMQRCFGFASFQSYPFMSLSCALSFDSKSSERQKVSLREFHGLRCFFFFFLSSTYLYPFDGSPGILPLNLLHVDWRILPIDLVICFDFLIWLFCLQSEAFVIFIVRILICDFQLQPKATLSLLYHARVFVLSLLNSVLWIFSFHQQHIRRKPLAKKRAFRRFLFFPSYTREPFLVNKIGEQRPPMGGRRKKK